MSETFRPDTALLERIVAMEELFERMQRDMAQSQITLRRLDAAVEDLGDEYAAGEEFQDFKIKADKYLLRIEELANQQRLTKQGIENEADAQKKYTRYCHELEDRVRVLERAAACPVCDATLAHEES
jgi:hypothetical protein